MGMNFNDAVQKLIYGKKLRRASWGDGLYITSNGDLVRLFVEKNGNRQLISVDEKFRLDDIMAEDWEIVV